MIVRSLSSDNAAEYQALRLRGLLEWPSAFASSHEEEVDTPITAIAARLQPKDDGAIFGAFMDDRLVGIVGLQRETMQKLAHKAYIWGMYVAPEARKLGVGKALLQHALDHARDAMQVRQVNLGVNASNDAAIALYKSLGFEPFGIERGFMLLDGELHDEIHMVRVL
ncbi:MAG: GNAT family N-acetyltransferase [Betaproteobacteria bacterium]|nr:GNAT family N-acetyltransferase [Betaproteobacteria bacterium]